MFALIVWIMKLSNFSFIPSIKKNLDLWQDTWWNCSSWGKVDSLSLGAADKRLAFLVMSALSLAAAGGPSQVWGVFRGAAVLPGRQGLRVGPCSAFQRRSCPSSLFLYFLVGHAMITSILAKCRFMDCTMSTLHQWLSLNVDLFKGSLSLLPTWA